MSDEHTFPFHEGSLIVSQTPMGGGAGYLGFQVTGMIEWDQKTQKIPKGFQQNPKKSLDQKLTCKKSHLKVPERGNDYNKKTNIGNWTLVFSWSLVHGRTPRNNADYCIVCAT